MIETKKCFEPGDIVMVFGNPMKLTHPIGQARLIKKISETDTIEHWRIQYLNDENNTYDQFIKKLNGKK